MQIYSRHVVRGWSPPKGTERRGWREVTLCADVNGE